MNVNSVCRVFSLICGFLLFFSANGRSDDNAAGLISLAVKNLLGKWTSTGIENYDASAFPKSIGKFEIEFRENGEATTLMHGFSETLPERASKSVGEFAVGTRMIVLRNSEADTTGIFFYSLGEDELELRVDHPKGTIIRLKRVQ